MSGVRQRAGTAVRATGRLLLGLLLVPVCVLGLVLFALTFLSSATFIGLIILPYAVRLNRGIAGLGRRLAAGWQGRPVPAAYVPIKGGVLARARAVLGDPMTWRDIGWIASHIVTGILLAGLGLGVWGTLGFDLSLPLWWSAPLPEHAVYLAGFALDSWPRVLLTIPAHFAAVAVAGSFVLPWLATAQAALIRAILATPERILLAERVAVLTETRTAALDAHGAELRRIERDLHDGAQARLVSIAMRLGVAERLLPADPARAAQLIAEARLSTEETMTELRDIIRGMYPPILGDRGLPGAVAALAARCPVPVTATVAGVDRLPAAVEAAAYFVIAEALTNVARHSAAAGAAVHVHGDPATLTLRVSDDGRGGADEASGTGLAGIRRRVAALDGRTDLSSPPGGPTTLTVELPCG
ncbi:histidine kinase [Acrocarpospora phusangensis]|uniref:histidine kinase n=1 Tax=Acrocarpospora phusangensis TaxID=1070424 RepID=A0A919UNL2_9ACTN|nr:sensor histidine kinase [Acrocarpospora phusangensis]GIH24453.1 histidine kinase [Acrocarpospora phusangensis]